MSNYGKIHVLRKRFQFGQRTEAGYTNEAIKPESAFSDDEDDETTSRILEDQTKEKIEDEVAATREQARQISTARWPQEKVAAEIFHMSGPFSFLNPSMRPIDILQAMSQPEDRQPSQTFDEFGFIVGDHSGEQSSTADPSSPASPVTRDKLFERDNADHDETLTLENDSSIAKAEIERRNKWIQYLEFTYNDQSSESKTNKSGMVTWSQVEMRLRRCRTLDELVKEGLPHTMRAPLWTHISRAQTLKSASALSYSAICDSAAAAIRIPTAADWERELVTVLPKHASFSTHSSVGVTRLARILRSLKWLLRTGGHLTGGTNQTNLMNIPLITAHLLLICDENDAFWICLSMLNELQSVDYRTILSECIDKHFSSLKSRIIEFNDESQESNPVLDLAINWYHSAMVTVFRDMRALFHFWDLIIYFGPLAVCSLIMGLLQRLEDESNTSIGVFNSLDDFITPLLSDSMVEIFLAGQQLLSHLDPKKLPQAAAKPIRVVPKIFTRSLSGIHTGNALEAEDEEDDEELAGQETKATSKSQSLKKVKTKNIRQTCVFLDLHEAIQAIAEHFQDFDPAGHAYITKVDYAAELKSDSNICLNQNYRTIRKHRRAKALIDFHCQDEDELGFKKHDIITIVNEKDEHCWVGELDGRRGWFPAKLVEIINETHGEYSVAGDDSVTPFINDLVRGRLCGALKVLFGTGLRKPRLMTMVSHPWMAIEQISAANVESDFKSVFSRLVLTKTFKLDEFTRVLTPCEILYRAVTHVNATHEKEPMDVKFRSLIVYGLNEGILHDWLTVISTTQADLLAKWYTEEAIIRTPAWKMVRAELRLLSQFSFNLNVEAEVEMNAALNSANSSAGEPKSPVSKDGVRDMLVKHHLFSWDI